MISKLNTQSMKMGLWLGLAFLINFGASLHPATTIIEYVVFPVIIIFLFRAIKNFRDKSLEGILPFGLAWSMVMLSFFYASLIAAFGKYIYVVVINPNYLSTQYDLMMQNMNQVKEISSAFSELMKNMQSEEAMESLQSIFTPLGFVYRTSMVNIFYGSMLGLIIAGFVYKKAPMFPKSKS